MQADIESCAANGARAVCLITALTVQDSRNVHRVVPVTSELLAETAELLLADVQPAAIKFGLLGSVEQLAVARRIVQRLRVPVVMDPILRAGGGSELVSEALAAGFKAELFALVDVLTPNAAEARRLTGEDSLPAAAEALLALGVRNVLITGGDERTESVVNWRFSQSAAPVCFEWPRLPMAFHGAGCTLAAAISAHLAQGLSAAEAIVAAQIYTQAALARAQPVGQGRLLPSRLP